jgi:hypothetical protein
MCSPPLDSVRISCLVLLGQGFLAQRLVLNAASERWGLSQTWPLTVDISKDVLLEFSLEIVGLIRDTSARWWAIDGDDDGGVGAVKTQPCISHGLFSLVLLIGFLLLLHDPLFDTHPCRGEYWMAQDHEGTQACLLWWKFGLFSLSYGPCVH